MKSVLFVFATMLQMSFALATPAGYTDCVNQATGAVTQLASPGNTPSGSAVEACVQSGGKVQKGAAAPKK